MAEGDGRLPRRFSRRRLLAGLGIGLGAVPVLGAVEAASGHEDNGRPPTKILRQGDGFLAYTRGDPDAGALYRSLVGRGFAEDLGESMLARDYAVGRTSAEWLAATAVYSTMHRPDGAFVALSAIRDSADPELRSREPEAIIAFPPPADDTPQEILVAVSGRVQSRS